MSAPEPADDGIGEEIALDATIHLAASDLAAAMGPVDAMLDAVINARAWQLSADGKRAEAAELMAHGIVFDEGLECDTCRLPDSPGWFRDHLVELTGQSRESIDDWAEPEKPGFECYSASSPWPCWVVLTHFPGVQEARRHIKGALDAAYGQGPDEAAG